MKTPRISVFSRNPDSRPYGGRTTSGLGFSGESRRQLTEADRRWKLKTILRVISAIFSLVGLSLYATAIPQWDRDFFWGTGPNRGDWQDGFPLGILLLALLWNLVAVFLLLGRRMALMPWIPLICDFLVWAILVAAITWSAGLAMDLYWDRAPPLFVDPVLWRQAIHKIGGLELGGVIFACLVWIIHFALFVYACIETHKWRKARKARKVGISPRALDHSEYAQDGHDRISAPPKYESGTHGPGIELNPTSPVERQFV